MVLGTQSFCSLQANWTHFPPHMWQELNSFGFPTHSFTQPQPHVHIPLAISNAAPASRHGSSAAPAAADPSDPTIDTNLIMNETSDNEVDELANRVAVNDIWATQLNDAVISDSSSFHNVSFAQPDKKDNMAIDHDYVTQTSNATVNNNSLVNKDSATQPNDADDVKEPETSDTAKIEHKVTILNRKLQKLLRGDRPGDLRRRPAITQPVKVNSSVIVPYYSYDVSDTMD